MKALERLGNIRTQVGLTVKQFARKDFDEVSAYIRECEKVIETLREAHSECMAECRDRQEVEDSLTEWVVELTEELK